MLTAVLCLVAQLCSTLCDPMDCSPPGSSVLGDFPGKNTGVGCHALHQGIFSTEGSNPGLPYCRQILYCLSHQGYSRTIYLQRPQNMYFYPRSLSGVPSAYSPTPSGMPQKQTDSSGITFPPPPVPNPLLP